MCYAIRCTFMAKRKRESGWMGGCLEQICGVDHDCTCGRDVAFAVPHRATAFRHSAVAAASTTSSISSSAWATTCADAEPLRRVSITAGVWWVRADLLDGVGILGNLVGPVVLEPRDGEDALHAGFCGTKS